MTKFTFAGFDCTYHIGEYTNGGTAIRIIDANDGSAVATASVWIGNLFNDEIAIKDYSENEGILDALIQAGIVHPPHRSVNGFPVVRLQAVDIRKNFNQ